MSERETSGEAAAAREAGRTVCRLMVHAMWILIDDAADVAAHSA